MTPRENRIRLKKFDIASIRRKAAVLEGSIAEFDRLAIVLDSEIQLAENRSGIHDPAHFAYPTCAKATRTRRENLKRSTTELQQQLADVNVQLEQAMDDLKLLEQGVREPAAS